jgi:hypothetical protein
MTPDDDESPIRVTTNSQRDDEIRAAANALVDRFTGPEPSHPESLRLWHNDRDHVRRTIHAALQIGRGERKLELTPDQSPDSDRAPERGPEIFTERYPGRGRGRGYSL